MNFIPILWIRGVVCQCGLARRGGGTMWISHNATLCNVVASVSRFDETSANHILSTLKS